jgi:hypothetical protein
LIGETISTHPEVDGRIEVPRTFKLSTLVATTRDIVETDVTARRLQKLFRAYTRIARRSRRPFVLEKSHANIWNAEDLASHFEDASFVGVQRDACSTVASMLRHGGIMRWYEDLPLDRPNRFLGVTEANRDEFASLSPAERCTWRWRSHRDELLRLERVLGDRFVLVRYEDFAREPATDLDRVARLLGVDNEFELPDIALDSLEKWRRNLSDEQVAAINVVAQR